MVKNTTLAELKKLDVGIKKGAAFEGISIPTIGDHNIIILIDDLRLSEVRFFYLAISMCMP